MKLTSNPPRGGGTASLRMHGHFLCVRVMSKVLVELCSHCWRLFSHFLNHERHICMFTRPMFSSSSVHKLHSVVAFSRRSESVQMQRQSWLWNLAKRVKRDFRSTRLLMISDALQHSTACTYYHFICQKMSQSCVMFTSVCQQLLLPDGAHTQPLLVTVV